mmetsp:Transcript_26800/g.38019  ORF Transcript_26800/g.38019 Transcript_26800/m.38019 type:complete len:302 (-) Transcript_26800:192-1097(-)
MADMAKEIVRAVCPDCWTEGCGLNGIFGTCADGLEVVNPILESFAGAIWCLGSPLAFPFIFCFSPDPHTYESSGYEISALQVPVRRPISCCAYMICLPCGQWHLRRQVLGGDMTKYKLWQGYHDGPHCCARQCPSAPITIEAGTYGEQDCPDFFLCLEVWILGGFWSSCCAFEVSRRVLREERGLNTDPTEARQDKCIGFFGNIMHHCFQAGMCCCLTSCCVMICAPDSEEAQECGGEAGRAARSCCRIAHTIWRGIMFTRVITTGCFSAQMLHEVNTPWDGRPKGRDPVAPKSMQMQDRG